MKVQIGGDLCIMLPMEWDNSFISWIPTNESITKLVQRGTLVKPSGTLSDLNFESIEGRVPLLTV
jgi:hypothetical protein